MQEQLIIYLHAHDLEHPSWAVVDEQKNIRQYAFHDQSEGLAQIAENKDVTVIVPAEDVLLTNIKLPKMNRSRLMQALPYALEDQLIDDVERLHFAVSDYQADNSLYVAILTQEKMQQWLALLQSWNVQPSKLMPASLALPFSESKWTVWATDVVLAKVGQYSGFACEGANFATLIDIALTMAPVLPKSIHVVNYTKESIIKNLALEIKIEEDFIPEEQIIYDAASVVGKAAVNDDINLLQGRYAVKKSKLPQMNKIVKLAATLAAIWVGLLFFYPIVSWVILAHRESAIETQIADIYKQNFPQSHSIVAPKIRLEEKLQKLSAQIGQNRLLLLMGYIGKAMDQVSGIKLTRIDYQNNQLTLELTAPTPEDLSAFTNSLNQQGLNVKQQNANLNNGRVNATVQVD